jgi:hypothetical protein
MIRKIKAAALELVSNFKVRIFVTYIAAEKKRICPALLTVSRYFLREFIGKYLHDLKYKNPHVTCAN